MKINIHMFAMIGVALISYIISQANKSPTWVVEKQTKLILNA